MFRIGFFESVIVILVILIVVKPKDLPAFMRKVGRIVGKLRRSYDLFNQYLREMEYSVKRPIHTILESSDKKERKPKPEKGKTENKTKKTITPKNQKKTSTKQTQPNKNKKSKQSIKKTKVLKAQKAVSKKYKK